MLLEDYTAELARNPGAMSKIEEEIRRIAEAPTLGPLLELQESSNPVMLLYTCKALEFRIKQRIGQHPLGDEISFVTRLVHTSPSPKVCEIFSLLGLFCWPAEMPNFLSETVSQLSSPTGYQILLSFLEEVNSNLSIDEKRRSELKKALGIVSNDLLSSFREEFSEFIIPIFTELLRILPKTFDFSIVFRHAPEHPYAAIEFISEALSYVDQNSLISILPQMPTNPCLVQVLTEVRLKNDLNLQPVFEYAFRCLSEDRECLQVVLEFWQYVFSSSKLSHPDAILDTVLIEVVRAFLDCDEVTREDSEARVFGFFTVISKNYPEHAAEFVQKNEELLPRRISTNLLNKLARSGDGLPPLHFNSAYLRCLYSSLKNDPSAPVLMEGLDLSKKDSVRLVLQILSKYNLQPEQLMALHKRCEGACISANEIKAECCSRLGMHQNFDGAWSMDQVIQYFYLLRKDRDAYIRYKESFYNLFLSNAPFDRCFSVVAMIGEFPPVILESIYQHIDRYPYIELNCFNLDLLPVLPIKRPFIEKEAVRFILEWTKLSDYREYYQALRSLLTVIEKQIGEEGMPDILIELLQIDCSLMVSRVMSIFNSIRIPFNTKKAVYYLLTAYNLPNLANVQAPVSQGLTLCLAQPDGPQAFNEVAGKPLQECVAVQAQISKCNRKGAVGLVRRFLNEFRGKIYNKLFENDKKVTKQNLFGSNRRDEDGSGFSIAF